MSTTTEAPPLTHNLKIWPEFFEAVSSGIKNFEVRDTSDREFAVGDTLRLQEYDSGTYTGREVTRTISYIVAGGAWGLPGNISVLGWSLEQAGEWRPTHRSNVSDELVRLIEETDEFVKVDSVSTIPADQFYPHFDPIDDPEPYDPTMYPYRD